ncbi:hypothetical protein [Nocardiopsis alba]|uniref:hypothetical protein n=1 Tax=Nocardiopsis alba TaxID=53437 RepID=UPI00363A4AC8
MVSFMGVSLPAGADQHGVNGACGRARSGSGLAEPLPEKEGEFLTTFPARSGRGGGGDQIEHLENIDGLARGEERRCTRGDLDPFRIEDFSLMDSIFRSSLHPEPTHGTEPTTTHSILQFFQLTDFIQLVTQDRELQQEARKKE